MKSLPPIEHFQAHSLELLYVNEQLLAPMVDDGTTYVGYAAFPHAHPDRQYSAAERQCESGAWLVQRHQRQMRTPRQYYTADYVAEQDSWQVNMQLMDTKRIAHQRYTGGLYMTHSARFLLAHNQLTLQEVGTTLTGFDVVLDIEPELSLLGIVRATAALQKMQETGQNLPEPKSFFIQA